MTNFAFENYISHHGKRLLTLRQKYQPLANDMATSTSCQPKRHVPLDYAVKASNHKTNHDSLKFMSASTSCQPKLCVHLDYTVKAVNHKNTNL